VITGGGADGWEPCTRRSWRDLAGSRPRGGHRTSRGADIPRGRGGAARVPRGRAPGTWHSRAARSARRPACQSGGRGALAVTGGSAVLPHGQSSSVRWARTHGPSTAVPHPRRPRVDPPPKTPPRRAHADGRTGGVRPRWSQYAAFGWVPPGRAASWIRRPPGTSAARDLALRVRPPRSPDRIRRPVPGSDPGSLVTLILKPPAPGHGLWQLSQSASDDVPLVRGGRGCRRTGAHGPDPVSPAPPYRAPETPPDGRPRRYPRPPAALRWEYGPGRSRAIGARTTTPPTCTGGRSARPLSAHPGPSRRR
jgi:hypothetical protein